VDLPEVDGVEFKIIEGYPDYIVGSDGTVCSKRSNKRGIERWWTQMSPSRDNAGYLRVGLRVLNSPRKFFLVHRLVAMAFVSGFQPELTVNHKDGNKQNNSKSNLEWCTYGENHKHAFKLGLRNSHGEANSNCTVSDEEVREIIKCVENGESQRSVALRFGISYQTVNDYWLGKRRARSNQNLVVLPENKELI